MSTIKQNKTTTYIDAGVNIDVGDQFINDIKPMVGTNRKYLIVNSQN